MKISAILLGTIVLSILTSPVFAAGNVQTSSPGAAASADAAPPSDDTTTSSSAESEPAAMVTAQDPNSVLSALTGLGYPGKLQKLDNGRASIEVTMSGLTTYVDFYDCADDMTDCYTLLFNVTVDLKAGTTLDLANKWNAQEITGRVWLDDSKDPTLDYSVSTFGGVSEDMFDQNVRLWDKKIGDFKDFFHF